MRKSLSYFLFLLWLSYLIVSSILLFMQGFLLKRTPLTNVSECMPNEDIQCLFEDSLNINADHIPCSRNVNSDDKKVASSVCFKPKVRVILMIIDALRYDFTNFDEKNDHPLHYQNKLPVIHKLLNRNPNSTRLYKFIADPPTTTLQRLKALTTGSLPTFIDASSNFASSEIHEDNFIDQLVKNKYNTVFMGDDTWNGLYPKRFTRNYSYPSFDVWDFDTVDNGVKEQLFLELIKTDWNLLIGHFLGVDHCGHALGPNHPKMARKLSQINDVIEDVIEQMDENMMLFVIGDHGMTSIGSHSGDSVDEVSASLFVHSKHQLLDIGPISESVKQIDFVPTLSSILGISIPFQNLGMIIFNCLPIQEYNFEREFKRTLYTLWSNVEQIVQYIQEYSKIDQVIKQEKLDAVTRKYFDLKKKLSSVTNQDNFLDFHKDTQTLINNIQRMCAEVWIQYEPFSMATGLLYMCFSIFFMYRITVGNNGLPEIELYLFLKYLLFATVLTALCYFIEFSESLLINIFFAFGLVSQLILVMIVLQNWQMIRHDFSVQNLKYTLLPHQLSYCLVIVFNLFGYFTTSYIVEESFVLRFLVITVILVMTLRQCSPNNKSIESEIESTFKLTKLKFTLLAMIIISILIRISVYFSRCREEQEWCFDSAQDYAALVKAEVSKLQWFITVVILLVYIFSIQNCDNLYLNDKDSIVKILKYFPIGIVVCVSGYWALKNGHININEKINPESGNILAWAAYFMISVGILFPIIKPLRGYMTTMKNWSIKKQNFIKKVFQIIWPTMEDDQENVFVACGLATVYSSIFIKLGLYLTLLFALLLGNGIAPMVIVMFLTTFLVLLVTSMMRIENATAIEHLFNVPNIDIVIWMLLSQHFFYDTGHQPSFSNIAWDAAFIGRDGKSKDNIIPTTLVLLNTFCSHIFMGILLPLLIITPFTLIVMIPAIIDKKIELRGAIKRGEVILSDQDSTGTLLTSMFTLASKYIIGHGIRVFVIILAATIHCRHSMAWRIFVPKLIFESIGMIVTLTSVLISYLILVRVNKLVRMFVIRFFSMETIFQC